LKYFASQRASFFGSRTVMNLNFWMIVAGLLLFLAPPAPAFAAAVSCSPAEQNRFVVLDALAQAQVIYLGETHDRPIDHEAELEILQLLHNRQSNLMIALEMFQKPYQASLDQYLAGRLTEADLLAQTEYPQRWGFNWDFYAPILRFAKANRIPLLAVNTPSEVTRKVSRTGLKSLTVEELSWIPPLSELDVSSADYRQRLEEAYQSFHQAHGNSSGFEGFFQAQILWDETMAEAIAQYWLQHPNRKIVMLVGQGHVLYGDGIPNRVKRRLKAIPDWRQQTVLLNPSRELQSLQSLQSRQVTDACWFTVKPTDPK
jgi:uncharacterized iron-regulated protein